MIALGSSFKLPDEIFFRDQKPLTMNEFLISKRIYYRNISAFKTY
jgi:hypothetical protein